MEPATLSSATTWWLHPRPFTVITWVLASRTRRKLTSRERFSIIWVRQACVGNSVFHRISRSRTQDLRITSLPSPCPNFLSTMSVSWARLSGRNCKRLRVASRTRTLIWTCTLSRSHKAPPWATQTVKPELPEKLQARTTIQIKMAWDRSLMLASAPVKVVKMSLLSSRRTRLRRRDDEGGSSLIEPYRIGRSWRTCESRRLIILCCARGLCHLERKRRKKSRI